MGPPGSARSPDLSQAARRRVGPLHCQLTRVFVMKEQIRRAVEDIWRHHCAVLAGALAESIGELKDLLRLDEYHRHRHDPDQLEHALGPLAATHLDLGSFSRMLAESTPPRSVAPRRPGMRRAAGIVDANSRGKEVQYELSTSALAETLSSIADAIETCCPDGNPKVCCGTNA